MFEKAKQVIVKENLEDSTYVFGAIQMGDVLIAMDNGAILDAKADWIEIVKELPWISLSDEMIGR
jgi:ABC-type sulfate transport system substrate-binding protein